MHSRITLGVLRRITAFLSVLSGTLAVLRFYKKPLLNNGVFYSIQTTV